MEDICDLFFELSNEDRLNILYTLREENHTVTSISNKLGLTTQEASRHLLRLGDIGLSQKNPNGTHQLTPYGDLSLSQIQGFVFTTKHKEYFQAHSLKKIPEEFIARIGELENSEYVDDIMVVFHRIEQMGREAEEYIYRLTDRYIITAIPAWEIALHKGVEFRLLESADLVRPPNFDNGQVIRDATARGQFKNMIIESADVFMAFSEKEIAGLSFPGPDGRIDYRGFISRDERALKWAKDLYDYYWDRSKQRGVIN